MTDNFGQDVRKGLSSKPKYLMSKYFYDEKGDELFQKIMGLGEYYLTDCEFEILDKYKNRFLQLFQNSNSPFLLTELGAGDGLKTKILLRHFHEERADFTYLPIDISPHVLNILTSELENELPGLQVKNYPGEYFHALDRISEIEAGRKVLLFLGSTIGNFQYKDAVGFLLELNKRMKSADQLIIGFDLKKDPRVILKAYDDSSGVTAAFNLNLLQRINNELGGDFVLDNFYHYPVYDPISGEAQSYLISKISQEVHIENLNETFEFNMGEPIFMEVSQKYDQTMIEDLALKSGFDVRENIYDSNRYFVDSVWEKK